MFPGNLAGPRYQGPFLQAGPRDRGSSARLLYVTGLNPGERRFAAYLDEHGYSWKHEPDYQVELGLGYSLATKPDFLVEGEDQRAVAEVRQFEGSVLQNQLSGMVRGGAVAPEKVFGQQRSALREKAEQLRPLAGLGVPLLIVLANALGKLVPLDDFHLQSANAGQPRLRLPHRHHHRRSGGRPQAVLPHGGLRRLRLASIR